MGERGPVTKRITSKLSSLEPRRSWASVSEATSIQATADYRKHSYLVLAATAIGSQIVFFDGPGHAHTRQRVG